MIDDRRPSPRGHVERVTPAPSAKPAAPAHAAAAPAATLPAIALPKGGGAIRGIGEKLVANPATGTASIAIPIACSPGRSAFQPRLALSYDSGAGNGPFGFGWALTLPRITRKTETGLPRYDDATESDVFIISDAEDLVPVLDAGGDRIADTTSVPGYTIHPYRPRIEGEFARIERWTRTADRDVHWRTISRDNLLGIYGDRPEARIADPDDPGRIFSWLLRETRDERGNAIVYDYKAEDGAGVDPGWSRERNRGARDDVRRATNRYPKRIRYGNREPLLDDAGRRPRVLADDRIAGARWMFEIVFDYGEHDLEAPTPAEDTSWSYRGDPFSMYRAGFEVRTSRLCRRVLMFHHFDAEAGVGADCLVRSTDLDYATAGDPVIAPRPIYSYLRSVTQSSYRRRGRGYAKRSMPPVELGYTAAVVQDTVHEVEDLEHLPIGIDGATYRWTDLHGEGLPGVLSEHGGAWFYQRNLTPISKRGVRFAPLERVATRPNMTLHGGRGQLMDLAGDGQPDLVALDEPVPGLYEHDGGESWHPFRPFESQLHRDLRSPDLRFVDLDGDGHADLLISEDDAFVWHPSLAERGFGPARRVPYALDEERGPRLVFADRTESIHLADVSGDGLADLVRIRNGEVCYWPNLGHGRFGAKITMDRAPWFDQPDQFDHRRIRVADIDGSGTADLIYLHRDGVRLYFNECGNAWSEPHVLSAIPRVDDLVTIDALDLLGNGTACLVWSSPAPADGARTLRYVDLMGGQKPHLLVRSINNLGAETEVAYASSTRFYLTDRAAGRPWLTRLPFPVHVVERIETHDRINGNRFVTNYAYHHGHFDGVEREFRGFALVEQLDTEHIPARHGTNLEPATHVPPVLTRTWFHTGVYLGRDRVSRLFADDYYREPGATELEVARELLDDSVLPPDLTFDEEREACRALRGALLRQEIYALDRSDREPHPYTVTEQSVTVRCVQRKHANRHGVFLIHPRESVGYHYEREPADPRVTHALTLEVDAFGNVLATAAVSYGRRRPDPTLEPRDQAKQAELHVVYAQTRFTNAIETRDDYRAPVRWEAQTYELTGLAPPVARPRFQFDEIEHAGRTAAPIAYEEAATPGVLQKRLLEHQRASYRRDDLTAALPFGHVDAMAIPFETYKLAFTPGLVVRLYGDKVSDAMLAGEAGYVHVDGDPGWWIPSGRSFFAATDDPADELAHARRHFFLATRHVDALGHTTSLAYDDHDLMVVETRDPVGNVVTVGERDASGAVVAPGADYRVLAPWRITDANGNRAAVSFDTLGMVVGSAVMGKRDEEPRRGDLLDGFEPDLPDEVAAAHLAQPLVEPGAILGRATTRLIYDLFAYQRTRHQAQPEPIVAYTLARETHDADLAPGEQPVFQHGFTYSDGFGREIQLKGQAEPGPDGEPRWVGSGWTVFDNKGKPARRYEPFFSGSHRYEPDLRVGVSPIPLYDPVGRVVATMHPDHAWDKVVVGAWRQEQWDVNDTALIADPSLDPDVGGMVRRLAPGDYLPTWYMRRRDGELGPDAQDAAAKTALHAATPAVSHSDSMGRVVLTIAHDRIAASTPGDPPIDVFHRARVVVDIENNVREVIDARDRVLERYDYGLDGVRVRQASMDAGERWTLYDVAGRAIRGWDSRGHAFRSEHDALGRPIRRLVGDVVFEHLEYGEGHPDAAARNLRGHPAVHRDPSGVTTHDAYDFKGNLLRTSRRLVRDYKTIPDWSTSPELDPETFVTEIEFDALGRPIASTSPDGSVCRATFNETNLLDRIDVQLAGAAASTPFVRAIAYDAKGQRQRIEYGNGTTTEYEYDPETFRLVRLRTLRGSQALQDLVHTYDPSGNLTRLRDHAIQTIYFANQVVTGDNDYTYNALYRLTEATGREHIGQASQPQPSWHDRFRTRLPHPGDGQAMQRYTERYTYDPAGNLETVVHAAATGNWTRDYRYDAPSALDPSVTSNRLTSTAVGSADPIVEAFSYDAHGNAIAMPHLPAVSWDFRDLLQSADLGGGGTVFYSYDATGNRTRKVVERGNGRRVDVRLYLGGFELYREVQDGVAALARATLHVMDDRRRVALVETRVLGDEPGVPARLIRYQLGDHLGSASLELDDQARIVSYEEYLPYGSTSYQAARSQVEAPKRYRYIAMERDDETGFAYHRARYYMPWLGRWASADPMGIGGGLNVYAYCNGDPINRRDTSGNDWTLPELNRFIDRSGDRRISLEELVSGMGCVQGVTLEDWAEMMSLGGTGGYRVDPEVRTLIAALAQQRLERNLAEAARRYEQNETALRMGADGRTYTNRGAREANKRWLNRHRDPKRLIATAVVAAAVVAPEAVAVVVSYETGVKTGEAITGTHSGIGLSDVVSGNPGKKTGQKMTPEERGEAVKDAALGWLTMGAMAWLAPTRAAAAEAPVTAAAATVRLTTAEIGALGEQAAVAYLRRRGFTNIRAIQNSSGHGIDLAADLNAKTFFFEVKASTSATAGSLSKAQSSIGTFVQSRLAKAAGRTGHWKSVPAEVSADAENLLIQIESGALKVEGEVINVTNVGSSNVTITSRTW